MKILVNYKILLYVHKEIIVINSVSLKWFICTKP